MKPEDAINIFNQCIYDYHLLDSVESQPNNSYPPGALEWLFYEKSWTDNLQWHLEDIIRDPQIQAVKALEIKRKIDKYNQRRTDLVELIDDWFFEQFQNIKPLAGASLNTETPAWAIDRLSILELKIWHMQIEAERKDATAEHRSACSNKLSVLQNQKADLSSAIRQLLDDILAGRKVMKLYRQMKMYNDESLNPVLYRQKNKK
jgi:hypothetical protein